MLFVLLLVLVFMLCRWYFLMVCVVREWLILLFLVSDCSVWMMIDGLLILKNCCVVVWVFEKLKLLVLSVVNWLGIYGWIWFCMVCMKLFIVMIGFLVFWSFCVRYVVCGFWLGCRKLCLLVVRLLWCSLVYEVIDYMLVMMF